MRRNRNTSRGGGGSSNMNLSSTPFLADHLKDIDLELDLLKRKREMLERQQLIQPLMQQQRNFNQQPFYLLEPKQSGSNRDFSHLYNDGSQQYRKPFGKKRQSDSDWQHDSYPKRSTGQSQRSSSYAVSTPARNQKPYGGQSQQKSTSYYGQSKPSIGQKISNQKPQRPAKNVVANKVTKPIKVYVPPNKLAAKPVPERNKLVAAAIKSVGEVEVRDREALRLRPDQIPTKQMTGRLELALGVILRDVRDMYATSSHNEFLRSATLQRVIKQAIRERIRSAMLGKVVGATQEIITEYRAMFPKNTDIEIVNIALEAGGVKPEKNPKPLVQHKERPDEFFKGKMIKLIGSHLHEMFDKLEQIYNAEMVAESSQEVNTETNIEEAVAVKEENTTTDISEANPSSIVDASKDGDVEGTKGESDMAAKGEGEEVAEGGGEEAAKDEGAEAAKVEGEEATKGEGDEAAKLQTEEVANPENAEAVKNESVVAATAQNAATVTSGKANDVVRSNVEELLAHANEYKRLLPRLLKRHIPTIVKLLHMNKMYKRAIGDLHASVRSKFADYGKPDESRETVANSEGQTPKFQTPYTVLPYYVKVMGKPQLPKKRVMHTFLDTFNPKSIKKHRSIHNLLFIGFTEKSDFDAIVQADGTVIGRSTLSIRICDKNPGKPEDNATADKNVSQVENANQEAKNDSSTDIFGSELDGQITDLLTSIDEDKVETSKSDAQQEEKPKEVGAEELADGETATVDNVDEVLDNIEENVDEVLDNIEEMVDEPDQNGGEPDQNGDETGQNAETDNVQDNAEPQDDQTAGDEKTDQVSELKNTAGRATPTRASTRLATTPATPSTIRTRRSSRQMQN